MLKRIPPKHRHDGTSPLPLGMDWSPPPKKWEGKHTIWPHDPQTGWSFCVTIPSWVIPLESRRSDSSLNNSVVFYRVQVGIQSPEGISTSRGILRRFSDFLKLFNALKHAFPKNIPPPPPKHAFLRINSSQLLLEERRYALEEWMGKLLSDIELSRSVPVASFLELEAAARSSFQDVQQHNSEISSRNGMPTLSVPGDSSNSSKFLSTELHNGTNILSESSDTSRSMREDDHNSGAPTNLIGSPSSDQQEEIPNLRLNTGKEKSSLHKKPFYLISSKDPHLSETVIESLEVVREKFVGHVRKLSNESIASDVSSVRGSEVSNSGVTNSICDGFLDFHGSEDSMDLLRAGDTVFPCNIVLSLDQQQKMNRILTTIHRRLVTATADMEDIITRLNQEIAVKEYLATKVKDLEVELENTKQKNKENLQKSILAERERVTQMQWDMEELQRKYLEMETRIKFEEDKKIHAQSAVVSAETEKELLQQELNVTKEQLENLQKRQEGFEAKYKTDIKVLVKEVKSLRNTQEELKRELGQCQKEKAELEKLIQGEKHRNDLNKASKIKLLSECEVLRLRLQECTTTFLSEAEDKFNVDPSLVSDALDLLTTSDNRIGLLLAEAQLLAEDETTSANNEGQGYLSNNENDLHIDLQIRKMLTDILVDDARLRKQVNSIIRCALIATIKTEKDCEEPIIPRKTVLNRFLDR